MCWIKSQHAILLKKIEKGSTFPVKYGDRVLTIGLNSQLKVILSPTKQFQLHHSSAVDIDDRSEIYTLSDKTLKTYMAFESHTDAPKSIANPPPKVTDKVPLPSAVATPNADDKTEDPESEIADKARVLGSRLEDEKSITSYVGNESVEWKAPLPLTLFVSQKFPVKMGLSFHLVQSTLDFDKKILLWELKRIVKQDQIDLVQKIQAKSRTEKSTNKSEIYADFEIPVEGSYLISNPAFPKSEKAGEIAFKVVPFSKHLLELQSTLKKTDSKNLKNLRVEFLN